jgi:hypothetical protein
MNRAAAAPVAKSEETVLGALEYVLRLLFFATVPFGIVALAALLPMGGAIINMVLALAAFFSGELLLGAAEKRPWIKRVLGRQLAFEAYYRERPPKPFLYYVFYPLLFPYWLAVREARRELILFKGYTILTFLVVVGSGVYRYFFVYQPELGVRSFAAAFAVGLVAETLATLMLIMPMTTSVVALHQKRHRCRLVVLLAVGLASATACGVVLAKRRHGFPSLETRQRVSQRTRANVVLSRRTMTAALSAAWASRKREGGWGREDDGTVTGPPLEKAREALLGYYRSDEAAAFELWTTSKKDKVPMMVLYAEGWKKGRPVFLAMKPDGTVVDKAREIPRAAHRVMRTAGDFEL